MKRIIRFILETFAISLLLSVINRVVFIIYYKELVSGFSFNELAQCFRYGLELDASIAGYIISIPLLACIACIWMPVNEKTRKVWQYGLTGYFSFMTVLTAIIETADIGMFGAWLSRIDSQIFIYTPQEMMASVSLSNFIAAAAYVIITVSVAVWLYSRSVRKCFTPEEGAGKTSWKMKSSYTFIMIIISGLTFLIVRGGVTTATANVSKAFFSNKLLLNQIAVNPVFSLMESTIESQDKDMSQYKWFTDEEAERIFAESRTSDIPDTLKTRPQWLKTERPDIVVVVMEGMGRTMTDIYEGDAPVAPEINRLKKEGLWFDRFYAASFRTDRGNVAIFSGFPGQPNMSIMKQTNKAAKLPGLPAVLRDAGYMTRFTYGGDSNFTNTRAYMYSCGFEEVVDETGMDLEGHRSKWGYADDIVLDFAADEIIRRIASEEQPVFDAILTLSSHEPYAVPYERLETPILNSFAFTDEQIGRFIEKLRASDAWKDLLVILVPDHSTPYPASIGNSSPETHHLPMLWLGGAVSNDMTINEFMSQTDIAATLLGQMGISHDQFIFSRDITSGETSRSAYWAFNNGFGIIDENGASVYDCSSGTVVRNDGDDQKRLEYGKAILQKTFIEIEKL